MAPSKVDMANESALQEGQQLLSLWLKVKGFIAKSFSDAQLVPEEEKAFLEAKSAVSQYTRIVSQKLPPGVKIGGESMQDMMRQAISMGHLRGLPKADKQVLLANWHASFITLARAVGCLQFVVEGYVPSNKEVKTGTGVKDLKGKKTKESKGWGKLIGRLLFWAVVAAAVWWYLNRE